MCEEEKREGRGRDRNTGESTLRPCVGPLHAFGFRPHRTAWDRERERDTERERERKRKTQRERQREKANMQGGKGERQSSEYGETTLRRYPGPLQAPARLLIAPKRLEACTTGARVDRVFLQGRALCGPGSKGCPRLPAQRYVERYFFTCCGRASTYLGGPSSGKYM
jgi:hypothetical protein